jgi:uncharacterized repeat protein (TIGR03803 family)
MIRCAFYVLHFVDMEPWHASAYLVKSKIPRLLMCGFLVLCATPWLRADRDADRSNERIPPGYTVHPPRHRHKLIVLPSDTTSPTGNGYTPQQLRHAYGFDQLNTTGAGQIIAIVDAYGSPTVQADLNTFCTALGLPSTTVQVYYPQGMPPADNNWATETSLDVEWAHAIAPGATIALIAARSNSYADLLGAVDYAVSIGAKQVSMSWGGSEYSTEATSNYHFNVPGVAFLVSSGDYGAGVSNPACSPFVVGVGGTTLNLDSSGNVTAEAAWSGSGGGLSAYEPIPSYQTGWLSGTQRGVPDVAYDANPSTGVPVYITGTGWLQVGGTSMSAPQWAALFALANSLRSQSISSAPSLLYSLATANYAGYYRDITSGSNGNPAGVGYDLVTGLGSPLGNQLVVALAGGFSSHAAAPAFFPPAAVYSSAQNVTIVSATPGASIRYTTDGSTPTETNGTLYSGPVAISGSATLNAIAYENGLTDSPVASGAYTFEPQAASPAFSLAAGTYQGAQTVTITSATSGVTIHYTTDGSTPTEMTGKLYSGAVTVNATMILNAIAFETGFADSSVTSSAYTIGAPAAAVSIFSPPAGTYTTAQTVTISTTTPGASIRYTTNGTNPSETYGTLYTSPVLISTTSTLKAIAYEAGFADGPIASAVYTINLPSVAAPVFSPAAETYPTAQTVTITVPSGAFVRYTTDGSTPTETNGTLYFSGAVSVGGTTVLKAVAYESGLADSPVASGLYTITNSPAAGLNVLHDFSSSNNGGINPDAGLIQASDGNFYGTTDSGGSNGNGTVYKITSTGGLTTLASFNGSNGSLPFASLIQATDGNFYGTTQFGGSAGLGTVFKVTPTGTLTSLVSFTSTNGAYPYGSLVQGSDGNFYGTTEGGGSGLEGTIFKITPAGILTTLVSFNLTNGGSPMAGMVLGGDGNFYGTTEGGGASNYGTIFKVTSAGVLTTLISFNYSNGANPRASLILGSDGNFYGTTVYGGNGIEGSVFEITPAGVLTTLASFSYSNGAQPMGKLVQGSDGNFYGTTSTGGINNGGTIFKVTPSGLLTSLASFNGSNGSSSLAGLVQGTDGNFYGTTSGGGVSRYGVVFQAIFPPQVSLPAFSPGPGTYSSAQSIAITSATGGASIRYTTDGSTPTETNGTLYSTPVAVGGNMTLTAIAYKSGISDSAVASGAYTINLPGAVSAPTFSPGGGTYTGVQSVSINTATSSTFPYIVVIRYTTDGSTPSETNGNVYSSRITVSASATINAIAYEIGSGLTDSAVSASSYTLQVAAPTFSQLSGTITSTQSVSISSGTAGAVIRYTTDGSTPSETNGTIYSAPVSISANTTLQAIAYKSGMADSTVSSSNYTLQAAAPTFSPSTGPTYTSAQSITITSTTSGATLRYTTDGSTPSESNGTIYSGPISINATTNFQAIAYASNEADSYVSYAYYFFNLPQVATPTFNPTGGTYNGAQSVTIVSTTSGASIRYTIDGTTPTETNGSIYSGPISVGTTTALEAVAYKPGYSDSGISYSYYTINLSPAASPVFNPAAGAYGGAQVVAITSTVNGATICYTTDGSTPTETNGTLYSGPVGISGNTMLKAIAYAGGVAGDSPVTSGLYAIAGSPNLVLNILHDFTSANNGGVYPYAGVMQGSDGNFYGTTAYGGSSGDGTLFKMTPAGVLTNLTSFYSSIGVYPVASPIQGSDGNLYGTTNEGGFYGYGTVFKVTSTGIYSTLASLTLANGAYLDASLVQGSDGNYYGTTEEGGSGGYGAVFKMSPTGAVTNLASFDGANTAYPYAGLVQGSDGNYYGTTEEGGSNDEGSVFKMTPTGAVTTLASFNDTDGAYPFATLVPGNDGNFYGTTEGGGLNSGGTVFMMTPSGVLTSLVSFNGANGIFPFAGLVHGSDGNFYGTTEYGGADDAGTIFKMTPGGALTTLVSFDGANGIFPEASLIQGSDGNLYGTTVNGGILNQGAVFQLIISSTAAPVFSPAAGSYNSPQSVTITAKMGGVTIRYTTDGSTPTETNGTLYSGPVSISSTTTLKAIAYETGFTDSAVTSGTYTINLPVSAPPASGGGGGGAFDAWFLGFLAFIGLLRWKHRKA